MVSSMNFPILPRCKLEAAKDFCALTGHMHTVIMIVILCPAILKQRNYQGPKDRWNCCPRSLRTQYTKFMRGREFGTKHGRRTDHCC